MALPPESPYTTAFATLLLQANRDLKLTTLTNYHKSLRLLYRLLREHPSAAHFLTDSEDRFVRTCMTQSTHWQFYHPDIHILALSTLVEQRTAISSISKFHRDILRHLNLIAAFIDTYGMVDGFAWLAEGISRMKQAMQDIQNGHPAAPSITAPQGLAPKLLHDLQPIADAALESAHDDEFSLLDLEDTLLIKLLVAGIALHELGQLQFADFDTGTRHFRINRTSAIPARKKLLDPQYTRRSPEFTAIAVPLTVSRLIEMLTARRNAVPTDFIFVSRKKQRHHTFLTERALFKRVQALGKRLNLPELNPTLLGICPPEPPTP